MKCYKITDEDYYTINNTIWGENVTHKIEEIDVSKSLSSRYWLHAYIDPRIAVIMNPAHGAYLYPALWEAWAAGEIKHDDQENFGCTELTTIREIPLPVISAEECVGFGIRCALKVCDEENYVRWANDWFNGKCDKLFAARVREEIDTGLTENWAAHMAAWATMNAEEALIVMKSLEDDFMRFYAARDEAKFWAASAVALTMGTAHIDLMQILGECGL